MIFIVIIFIILMISYLIAAGLIFLLSLLLPFTFSFKIVTVIWLIAVLIKSLFGSSK